MKAILAATALCLCSSSVEGADCAKYEPSTTQLTGKLILRDYPGPPNYESVESGNRLERQWIVELSTALCIEADPTSETSSESVEDIQEIQLVLLDESIHLSPMLDKSVEVTGELFRAHTGHHHTPVLLVVKRARLN